MKYLLIILLLCAVTVTAQERIDLLPNYNPYQKKGDIVFRDDSRIFEQWLVDEWQSYQKECYADSTKECYNVFKTDLGGFYSVPCSERDVDLGFYPNYLGTKEMWIHREPTFEGFMRYLLARKK